MCSHPGPGYDEIEKVAEEVNARLNSEKFPDDDIEIAWELTLEDIDFGKTEFEISSIDLPYFYIISFALPPLAKTLLKEKDTVTKDEFAELSKYDSQIESNYKRLFYRSAFHLGRANHRGNIPDERMVELAVFFAGEGYRSDHDAIIGHAMDRPGWSISEAAELYRG